MVEPGLPLGQQPDSPLVHLVQLVEPILLEEWDNLRLDDCIVPRGAALNITVRWDEKAVPDAVASAQIGRVTGDRFIQCGHSFDNPIHCPLIDGIREQVLSKDLLSKCRCYRGEREAPSERVIDNSQAPVCGIHHPENVYVPPNVE